MTFEHVRQPARLLIAHDADPVLGQGGLNLLRELARVTAVLFCDLLMDPPKRGHR